MKADTGMSGYPAKVAGVIISLISLIGFILCKLIDYDPALIDNLFLTRLFSIVFACGLVLFVFSKDKKNVDGYIQATNMISRYFLTALYSCLIAFNFVQSMDNDYSIDVLIPVLFFLILQIIYTLALQYHNLSGKSFYIFSTVVFLIGLVLLLLL